MLNSLIFANSLLDDPALSVIFMILVSLENVKKYSHVCGCTIGAFKQSSNSSYILLYFTRDSLYHTEQKSRIIAKSIS